MEENTLPVLCIENPSMFRRLTQELILQSRGGEGHFILSENWEPVSMQKNCAVLHDPFDVDLNDRKIISSIYKLLDVQAHNERFFLQTTEIMRDIDRWLTELETNLDYPLVHHFEASAADLFKAFDMKPEQTEDILERIHRWIVLQRNLLRIPCLVFVNLRSYFSAEEMAMLYQYLMYTKCKPLMLECTARRISPDEQIFVIDKDLCEIYNEEE